MKKVLFSMMLALFLTSFMASAYASDKPLIDKAGVIWQYGKGSNSHSTNTVNRFTGWIENRSLLPDPWAVQAEGHYSMHKFDEYPDFGQDTHFREYGINLVVKRYFLKDIFYLGILGGLSYVHDFPQFEDRSDWSQDSQAGNIGRSHCLGTFGAMAGRDWHIYKAWSLRTEFRYTHTSDPFSPDAGKNYWTGGLGLGLTFKF